VAKLKLCEGGSEDGDKNDFVRAMPLRTTTEHENAQSPLGRGKSRQALGWVAD
jgi:hypothetical protein